MSQISNKFLAQIPANTLKGNNTGSPANVSDLTIAQVQTMLSIPTASSPLAIGSGGTGQTTAAAAFNSLNPMTTTGDLIYESATNVASRLPIGSTNQVLTVVGGVPAWSSVAASANQALSNLASVAINTSLLPGTTNTINLGSTSFVWQQSFTGAQSTRATQYFTDNTLVTAMATMDNGSNVGNTPSSVSTTNQYVLINTLNKHLFQFSQNNALANATASGSLYFETGNKTVGTGDSGSIFLQTGTATGTRGVISLNGASINANSTQIHNVVDPTSAQDAATKNYVDTFSGSAITSLTGDVTATGPGAAAATLATVNGNVGTFGSSTSIPTFTVNAKGLITAASGNAVIATAGTLSGTTLNATVVTSSLTSLGAQSVALNMNSHQINNVTDPTSAQDAATKSYVDNLSAGLSWKQVARAATTANITLSAPQTIDGVSVIAGDRVLVKNQTASENNGLYLVAAGAWTRTTDADTGAELVSAAVFISEGTANADKAYVCTTDAPITIGVTAITFVQFSSIPYTFGNGLNLTGNNVTVLASNSSILVGAGGVSAAYNTSGALETSTGIRVRVDAATVKINGSNNLEGLKPKQENLTLNGTDITNQYKDLAFAVYGASASDNSVVLSVVGGPIQQKTVDYTVSLTGGSGGVTRITFAGDLATGGNAALVNGDILMISYSYLT